MRKRQNTESSESWLIIKFQRDFVWISRRGIQIAIVVATVCFYEARYAVMEMGAVRNARPTEIVEIDFKRFPFRKPFRNKSLTNERARNCEGL